MLRSALWGEASCPFSKVMSSEFYINCVFFFVLFYNNCANSQKSYPVSYIINILGPLLYSEFHI